MPPVLLSPWERDAGCGNIYPHLLVYIPDSQRYFQAVIHEVHGGSK